MIAAVPRHGGATWAVLQYLLGLRNLGHRVVFVEPIEQQALRPAGVTLDHSDNAAYCAAAMDAVDLGDAWALLADGTLDSVGLARRQLDAVLRRADVLLNLSGVLDPELAAHVPVRVHVDIDPGFTQLWHDVEGIDMRLDGHTHFVTVGSALGQPDCRVPLCGRDWITTFQPVVLSHWPVGGDIVHDGLTTVANWRSHGSITHDGIHYGQKAHSFRRLFPLAEKTDEPLLLALGIHPDEASDLAELRARGWRLLDPATVAATPDAYRRFIRGSKGELGIAKGGYVASGCGWFSDRSVCYLAAGRPVLAQDTGFSRFLPTGEGLLSFDTVDDAVDGIDRINGAYPRHRHAARQLAEEYFDATKVMPRLLDEVGSAT